MTELTASFGRNGTSGTSGCNSYQSLARVEDGPITFEAESSYHAEKACEGPDGVMEQEELHLDLLPQLTRYGIYGDGLSTRAGDVFLLFQVK